MNLKFGHPTRLLALAAVSVSILLSACGGGGGSSTTGSTGGGSTATPPVSLSGVVADGLIQGAQVCYDLNDNGRCDTGEPVSSSTGANGAYTLEVPAAEAGKHAVIAIVPVGAVDADTGTVTTAYTLKAPPNTNTVASLFVSPITTIVQEVMQASGTTDPAQAIEMVKQQLGMSISPLVNFIALRDTDPDAARAGTISQVITAVKQEVAKTSDQASVPEAQKTALISVVVLNNLSNFASSVAEQGTKTSAQVAQQLASSQGITSATVATQAQIASSVLTATRETATSTTPVPFVTVRDFRYTDANNWSYRLFTGDDVTQSDGFKYSNEIRKTMANGVVKPYNRDHSYYDTVAAKWYECPSDGYLVIKYTAPTATADGTSRFCRTYSNTNKRSDESVAGSTIKSVVERIRNSGLPGYATWGPDPSILNASATFPAGAGIRYQIDTAVATPDGHSLSSKVRVFKNTTKAFNDWPFAATLDEMIQYYPGNIDSGVTLANGGVTGSNTDGLRDVPDAGFVQAGYQSVKNFRVAYKATSATSGTARFYLCRRNVGGGTVCNGGYGQQLFDTTYTIETLGEARVLKFASFPTENEAYWKYRRQLTERAGAVFYGFKDILGTSTSIRLNKAAWDALRAQLPAVTAHSDPLPPEASESGVWLRDMREGWNNALSTDTFSIRAFKWTVNSSGTGGTSTEVRINFEGDNQVAFNRNAMYLMNGVWRNADSPDNQCPSSGVDVSTFTNSPRASSFCNYFNDTATSFDVDISGKAVSTTIAEMRLYGSFDFGRDYASYGPGPSANSTDPDDMAFNAAIFPAGSKLRYQVGTVVSSVPQLSTGNQVRNGATTYANLAAMRAAFNGGYNSVAVNGGTTLGIYTWQSNATPNANTTGQKRLRVAFAPTGNEATWYLCDAATGAVHPNVAATTGCVAQGTTTWSESNQGGKNVLRFASYPSGIDAQRGNRTLLIEHASSVYFGGEDIVGAKTYSQRLNGVATNAIFRPLTGSNSFDIGGESTCTSAPCSLSTVP